MLKFLIKTFFLWRRNDAKSIMVKTLFFGGLGWVVAGWFTSDRNALVAAAVLAVCALVKYTLQYTREQSQMLKVLGGDKEKLRNFKAKMAKSGVVSGLMMEALRAEMGDGDDEDYEDYEETPLTDEQRATNRAVSQANLDRILAAVDVHPQVNISADERDERIATISEDFAHGEYEVDIATMLPELLEERSLSFCYEDYCNENDHAYLLEAFAQATQGAWEPTNASSEFDEETEKVTVRFTEAEEERVWRFNQNGDWVSQNFLCNLIKHTEKCSGLAVIALDTEDMWSGLVVPRDFYAQLNGEQASKAA